MCAASWGFPSSQDSARAKAITFEATPVVHHSKFLWIDFGRAIHLHPDPERLRFLSVQSRDSVITASGAQITAGDPD
jgi:hypothetical protein